VWRLLSDKALEPDHTGSPPAARVFFGAPGRAHTLAGSSPAQTRQGELLAEGKGVHREVESEGSRKQNAGSTNRTAYEASVTDERAKILKVQNLHGSHEGKCGGHKRGGVCALPGEISLVARDG
jgi:hypothetical protein